MKIKSILQCVDCGLARTIEGRLIEPTLLYQGTAAQRRSAAPGIVDGVGWISQSTTYLPAVKFYLDTTTSADIVICALCLTCRPDLEKTKTEIERVHRDTLNKALTQATKDHREALEDARVKLEIGRSAAIVGERARQDDAE